MNFHATALIEDGAQIGDGVRIGAFCRVGPKVRLEAGVDLKSHAVIDGRTTIGARTVVHSFAVLGGPPQHLGYKGEDTALTIGADCIIREHVTMSLGTVAGRGETRVGDRCFFMAASHVAHDCVVGEHAIFANNATLGGHVTIEDFVFLGGLCAIHQHGRVGAHAFVGGCATVTTDIIPYASAIGNHACLSGLNIVGLKRRGFSRQSIHALRSAYKMLFAADGSFAERVDATAAKFCDQPEVMRVVEFIRAPDQRPLMAPRR